MIVQIGREICQMITVSLAIVVQLHSRRNCAMSLPLSLSLPVCLSAVRETASGQGYLLLKIFLVS